MSQLTQKDIDEFFELGYLKIPGVLSPEEAEHYRQTILGMIPRDLTIPFPWRSVGGRIKPYHEGYGDQKTRYGHEDDGIWDTPEFLPMLCHEGLYDCAADLMGTKELRVQDGTIGITLRSDTVVLAAGGNTGATGGGVNPLSQPLHVDPSVPPDVPNFTFADAELQVGGLFYLTDVEELGGGIHVVPGGHKLVEEQARAAGDGGRDLHSGWKDIHDFPETIEITGKAGDFIMTHYLLPHAGSHNRQATTRVAYFIRFSRQDHPFFPPPAAGPTRYNDRQLHAMSKTGRRLLGVDRW